jgi:hypothetical protein
MSEGDVTDRVPGDGCGVRTQGRCTGNNSACALTLIRDLDGGGTIHNQLPGGVRLILPSLADPWLPGLEPIYGEPVSVHPALPRRARLPPGPHRALYSPAYGHW